MATFAQYKEITLAASGGTQNIDVTAGAGYYGLNGSGSMSGSWNITPVGTPLPCIITFFYNCNFVLGGNTFTIFSQNLTAQQCKQNLIIYCRFNGTTWLVSIVPDLVTNKFESGNIADGAIETVNLDDAAVTGGKIASSTIGDGNISGSAAIAYSKLNLSSSVQNSDMQASTLTPSAMNTTLNAFSRQLIVSFESGEQCSNKFLVNGNFSIPSLFGSVIKAVAGTDSGTVTLKINGVAVTGGLLTFPASSALDATQQSSCTALNTYTGGSSVEVEVVGAKTTAGGKILVSILFAKVIGT